MHSNIPPLHGHIYTLIAILCPAIILWLLATHTVASQHMSFVQCAMATC